MSRSQLSIGRSRWSMNTSNLLVVCTTLIFFVGTWFVDERPIVLIAAPMLMWLFFTNLRTPIPQPSPGSVITSAVALLVYDLIAPRIIRVGHPDEALVVGLARVTDLVWLGLAAILIYRLRRGGKVITRRWRAGILLVAAVLGTLLILITPNPLIDVWELHQQGGESLLEGTNPYADINVISSFEADGDSRVITGYPYTPPNLIGFGTTAAVAGDPRWFSLVCWLAFLAIFGSLRRASPTSTALMLLLASQPAWQLVLEIGYTESLTLAIFAGAVLVWRHRSTMGPALLGLALATKQYLVALAPMIFCARLLPRRSRLVALATAGLIAISGVVWGAGDYFDAIVAFHLRVPPQPDAVNLYGATGLFGTPIEVPAWIGVLASVAVGLISARTARTPPQLMIGAAAALGIGFFLSSQAFVNYWLLLGGVLTLAMLLAAPADPPAAASTGTVGDKGAAHVA